MRSNDSFNFPLGLIKCIVIVNVVGSSPKRTGLVDHRFLLDITVQSVARSCIYQRPELSHPHLTLATAVTVVSECLIFPFQI